MDTTPITKKQKVSSGTHIDTPTLPLNDGDKTRGSPNFGATTPFNRNKTPKHLTLGKSGSERLALSQPVPSRPTSSLSINIPNLVPPTISASQGTISSSNGSIKTYSQSPPRSPSRSPARKLELIQLSPMKNTRLELRKLHDAHQAKFTNKERLYVHKLVLRNFKSYAGKQVIGPLDTSFSAIVGPNGSGKSNVIDSMLFVFGFRASKMRQDRLSDLIHKSESYQNLDSCSVEITFRYVVDEGDGSSRVDEEKGELVVERRAFRNNTSKYYVNGKESSYTEVTKLLRQQGIDLDHKRFLILQGEVENIAQMKPKAEKENDDGLLEYLEDIIGTAKYKPMIEEKLAEIEMLNDVCIERENRFNIVDREKQSLESGKDAALEFLEKERELTLLKSKKTQYELFQNNAKLQNTLQRISDLNTSLEEENSKLRQQQGELDATKDELCKFQQELQECMEQEQKINESRRQMEIESASIDETIKNQTRKKEDAEHTLQSTQKTVKECTERLRKLEEEQQRASQTLTESNEVLKEEQQKLDAIKLSLREKTVDMSQKIAVHEKELEPWENQLRDKKLEIQLAESEVSVLKESQARLERDIEVSKEEIKARRNQIAQAKKKIVEYKEKNQVIVGKIQEASKECQQAREKLKDLESSLNVQRQRTSEARSALLSVENKNKVLVILSKLQRSGRISGFYGRLGDLGSIDERYDVAISTACPRLDDIVVETVECGQQCIEYLRKNKLGYARFILLDKLKAFRFDPIPTPENVPRLFDLVTPKDPKFKAAFYSVLRDTLVAADLKQANRVAYGKRRFKVVTLDGKLIDISGTMTGGGSYVSKGLMKLSTPESDPSFVYTEEEVRVMESQLAEKEKKFQMASELLYAMEQEQQRLRDESPKIELEISKWIMDIDSLQSDILVKEQYLNEKVAILEQQSTKNGATVAIMDRIVLLKEDYQILERQMKEKKDIIQELKDKILKTGGTELQEQNSKVLSLTKEIEKTTQKLRKLKSQAKGTENSLRRAERCMEDATTDVNKANGQLQKLEKQMQEVREETFENEDRLKELAARKTEVDKKIQTLKEKLSDLEIDIKNYTSLRIELNEKIRKLEDLSSHVRRSIDQLHSAMKTYKIRNTSKVLERLSSYEQSTGEDLIQDRDDLHKKSTDLFEDHGPVGSEVPTTEDDPMDVDAERVQEYSEEELKGIDIATLEEEISVLEEYFTQSNVDIDILEEYIGRLIEFRKRKLELQKSIERRDNTRVQLEDLKKKRYDEFMEGFGIISITLKEMYQMITMGGNAELELVDSLDPFSEGVTFSVMPPKKSWRNITNLSGGEKTLSSLALVFALHKYKPTPLYVMDEIDAALDFRNVSIVANYIKERTKNAQFIVISLRNNMFELAKRLVGIYKRKNETKSATIKNKELLT